eukprot:TRINITY_DN63088_c0_g1_i1.p1 TRINITY_DN63088_c0_g1~~TRINITY_DN63088_c0_g1_i1.p1  ORF type:complete len:678 (-),score=95.84 TRINITY_DN63088_c0_g1_i1:271-2304(-)
MPGDEGVPVPVVRVELTGGGRRCSSGSVGGTGDGVHRQDRPSAAGSERRHPSTSRACFGGGVWGTALVQTTQRLKSQKPQLKQPAKQTQPPRADQTPIPDSQLLGPPSEEKAPSCLNCGNVYLTGVNFCHHCGEKRGDACSACGNIFMSGFNFCPQCGQKRNDIASASNGPEKASMTPRAKSSSPRRPTTSRHPHSYASRAAQRAASVVGLNGKPPSIAERTEVWLASRQQKVDSLREKCASELGSFTPELWKPERSPRWLASPEGGGNLHDRGMRSKARKAIARQKCQEEKLDEELRQCPFTPTLTSTWSPAQAASPSSEGSPLGKAVSTPLRAAVLASACDENRPCPHEHVTDDRANLFYDRQCAWLKAKMEEQKHRKDQHIFKTLQEESKARKSAHAPQGSGHLSGVLPRTFYDRQIAWLRQREYELGDLRRTQLEELTGRKSRGSSRSNSQCTTPRRSPSAPVSPRSAVPSDEVVTDCENYAWNASPDAAARLYSCPPPWQRHVSPANHRQKVAESTNTERPAASMFRSRSRSASSSPRFKTPRAEGGESQELRSGAAIVSKLRFARQEGQGSLPADAWLCQPSKQPPALWSRSAPLRPKSSQKQETQWDSDDIRSPEMSTCCPNCGSIYVAGTQVCRRCGQQLARHQPSHSFGCASAERLDYTADFGSPSDE